MCHIDLKKTLHGIILQNRCSICFDWWSACRMGECRCTYILCVCLCPGSGSCSWVQTAGWQNCLTRWSWKSLSWSVPRWSRRRPPGTSAFVKLSVRNTRKNWRQGSIKEINVSFWLNLYGTDAMHMKPQQSDFFKHHCKLKPVNCLVVQAVNSLKEYFNILSSFTTPSCHF